VVTARLGEEVMPEELGITSCYGGTYWPSIMALLRAAMLFSHLAPLLRVRSKSGECLKREGGHSRKGKRWWGRDDDAWRMTPTNPNRREGMP
jgi:hypothetical protein